MYRTNRWFSTICRFSSDWKLHTSVQHAVHAPPSFNPLLHSTFFFPFIFLYSFRIFFFFFAKYFKYFRSALIYIEGQIDRRTYAFLAATSLLPRTRKSNMSRVNRGLIIITFYLCNIKQKWNYEKIALKVDEKYAKPRNMKRLIITTSALNIFTVSIGD